MWVSRAAEVCDPGSCRGLRNGREGALRATAALAGARIRAETFPVSQAWKAKCPELLDATVQFQGNLHWHAAAPLAC